MSERQAVGGHAAALGAESSSELSSSAINVSSSIAAVAPAVVKAAWEQLQSIKKWESLLLCEPLSGGMLNHVYRCEMQGSSFVLKVTSVMLGPDPASEPSYPYAAHCRSINLNMHSFVACGAWSAGS